jgi:hypothetical protein
VPHQPLEEHEPPAVRGQPLQQLGRRKGGLNQVVKRPVEVAVEEHHLKEEERESA